MLDFFIALFGGAYYYGKCCKESNIRKRNDAKLDRRMQKIRIVWNAERLNQIRQRFVADPHAALEEIADELYFIFRDYDWRVLFRKCLFFEQYDMVINNGFFSIWQIAYSVYAAKHGQVLSLYTEYHASDVYKMLGISDDRNEGLARGITVSACQMIDHCLREYYGNDDDFRLQGRNGRIEYCKIGIMVMPTEKDYYPIFSDFNVAGFAENVRNNLAIQYAQRAEPSRSNALPYFRNIQQTQTR